MLSVFGVVASCNVLFVGWRMWVAHQHPRDAVPRHAREAAPAASVTTP